MDKSKIKKSIIISVITIFILLIGIWFGKHLYYYYHPPITIVSMWGQDEDFYMSTPSFGIEYRSVFGIAPKITAQIEEFAKETEEVYLWLHTFVKPMNVNSTVEIIDGQTIVTYEGTATTEEGEVVEIDKQLIFDFVLTEDIQM